MNCWEYNKCGRDKCNPDSDDNQACPAFPDYGKSCAIIAGTLGTSPPTCIDAIILGSCLACKYYTSMHYEGRAVLSRK